MTLTALQQEIRQGRLTASSFAAAVGMHPYKSPHHLYLEMIGEIAPTPGNEHTEMGHFFERPILEAGAKRLGVQLDPADTVIHPQYDWIAATPDAKVRGKRELLEAKNVGRTAAQWDDGIPPHFAIQADIQLACLDYERCHLVAFFGGADLRVIPHDRNPETERWLIERGREFMRRVELRDPPPADGSEAVTEYLRQKYPKHTQPPLEPTPDDVSLVARYRQALAEAKTADDRRDDLKAEILRRVGDHDGFAGLCTYRANRDSTVIDWEAVARELGAPATIVARFTSTKRGARSLRLKGE